MMTQKPNFQQMSRKDLRSYAIAHREDDEALRIYMDRLQTESGVIRYRGEFDRENFSELLTKEK